MTHRTGELRSPVQNERGFMLIFICGLMLLVTSAVTAALIYSDASNNHTSALAERMRAFYAAAGAQVVAYQVTGNLLAQNPQATSTQVAVAINTFFNNNPSALPTGMSLMGPTAAPIQVTVGQTWPNSVVPNGPYAGLQAPQQQLQFQFALLDNGILSNATSQVNLTSTFAEISMFQFIDFVIPDIVINSNEHEEFKGHFHSNGNVCLAWGTSKDGPMFFATLTVAGALMNSHHAPSTVCPAGGNFNAMSSFAYVATDNNYINMVGSIPTDVPPANLDFYQLQGNVYDNCVNCGGTSMSWAQYAPAIYNNHLLDGANGVTPLQLPTGGPAITQPGANGSTTAVGMNTVSNATNSRFLIDPVIEPSIATESTTVKAMKFSYLSDIRILDGVWYIRDSADPTMWPGHPIWSDHPGSATLNYLDNWGTPIQVGQDDIKNFWSTTAQSWGANVPRNYSYYAYDKVNQTLLTSPDAVISYGNLSINNMGAGTSTWSPGGWLDVPSTPTASPLCSTAGSLLQCIGASCPTAPPPNLMSVAASVAGLSCTGTGVNQPSQAAFYLNGTRSGLADLQIENMYNDSSPAVMPRAEVLPINFSVSSFIAALQNTTPGELGSYFGASGYLGRPFNGIIYISASWPGADLGFGTPPGGALGTAPTNPPGQGAVVDSFTTPAQSQPFSTIMGSGSAFSTPGQNQALPYEFCSSTLANNSFDGASSGLFFVPKCANYGTTAGKISAYPDALRIFNGRTALNIKTLGLTDWQSATPTDPTGGLTIISNLPGYIQGDMNLASDVSSQTAPSWMPMLIGIDFSELLTNGWDDANSRWDVPIAYASSSFDVNSGLATTYTMSLLTSWATQKGEWNFQSQPGFMEDFGPAVPVTLNGSIVSGFYPVYEHNARLGKVAGGGGQNTAADRIFLFDPHLNLITNQPQGSPRLPIYSVQQWHRN